jgi:hypothetical protein
MDYSQKKKIVERAKRLKDYEYVHLFRIIKKDPSSKYSSNKNGIFINLKNLNDETLKNIDNYLDFVEGKDEANLPQHNNISNTTAESDTKQTSSFKKLEYETIYHQCYQDLSNYQKTLLKQHGKLPGKGSA